MAQPASGKKRASPGISGHFHEIVEKWREPAPCGYVWGMNELHSDALLGGLWTWDPEIDEVSVHDATDEVHDLLRDLMDTLDD